MIIQAGIKRVIAPAINALGVSMLNRIDWDDESIIAIEMLTEAGVEILYYGEEK